LAHLLPYSPPLRGRVRYVYI